MQMEPPLNVQELIGTGAKVDRGLTWSSRIRWAVGVLVAVAGSVAMLARSGSENEHLYITEPVIRGDLTVAVTATGKVEPRKEVSVGVEVSGTVEEVYANFNDTVAAGQLLARLDTARLTAQLEESRASLALARANQLDQETSLKHSEREFARLLRVYETGDGGLLSERELDEARTARDRAVAGVDIAKAQVRQASAQLAVKQTELDKARIISPIDGVVLSRRVDPGQTVAASFQTPELFVIAEDLAEMQLSVEIDQADVGQVRAGQQARFTVDTYPDEAFPAEIATVRYAPVSNAGVVTYEAILAVENSALRLRPGMTATATVTVNSVSNVLLVPNAALRFAPQVNEAKNTSGIVGALLPRPPGPNTPSQVDTGSRIRKVWVLDQQGLPEAVEIVIGASDGSSTEILSGDLREGALVVVEQQGESWDQ
jgi:HlyD family secretion protein